MHTGRRLRSALGAITATLWIAALPARAQEPPPASPPAPPAVPSPPPIARGALAEFEGFLDWHPYVEARLRENPSLVNDRAFQKNHPPFAGYLARHPGLAAELAARPRWFIHRELVRQSASPVTLAQVADFDRFLDQHPRLERQLALHPPLLRNPDFISRVPELHDYLKQHPGISRAAELKPGWLMQRERRRASERAP